MTVYLDHNATTPLLPEAKAAMARALDALGNPSSVHASGRAARARVEAARESVARLVGARARDVIFTSGATEAIGLAVAAMASASQVQRFLVSAVEHDAVRASVEATGLPVEVLPVDGDGRLSPDTLVAALRRAEGPVGVAIMAANNETGVWPIDPAMVAERAREHGALVLCDAVQAAGKEPVSIASLGTPDFVALSAHKLGGPAGIGALIVRPGTRLAPVQRGGGQEQSRRAGTENVIGIVGFGAAAEAAPARFAAANLPKLQARLEAGITERTPDAVIAGGEAPRLATTTCIAQSGKSAEVQLIGLDLKGIEVSAGAACSSGKVRRSHVLSAMGFAPEAADAALRISLGWPSQDTDVDQFLKAWEDLWPRAGTRRSSLAAVRH
ncbi:MAG: cysteine desulfurase family protein [Pseudomonadota bacterium]